MKWLRELTRRLSMVVHRRQFDADLKEEMRLHLELRKQERIESGVTAEDARAAARRRFGNPTVLREKSHTAWGWEWLEELVQDVNYGAWAMLRSPGITLVALLSLDRASRLRLPIFTFKLAVVVPVSVALALHRNYPLLGTISLLCLWQCIRRDSRGRTEP